VLPPQRITPAQQDVMRAHSVAFAQALGVVGLMNVQYAIKDDTLYVIEVNPRASRTIPFVSKAIGVPLASLAARAMLGETLESMGLTHEVIPTHISVKEAVFPFNKFREFDPILGPEMRSTGEVMGIATTFGEAFAKAQAAASNTLPRSGAVFLTVTERDKARIVPLAERLVSVGFTLYATDGTAAVLRAAGLAVDVVHKVGAGRPDGLDLIKNGAVHLLINTSKGKRAQQDAQSLRQAAIAARLPYTTTLSAARAAVDAIVAQVAGPFDVRSIQEWTA
jgi:carbamoyl-phosphate synthase large subunit